MLPAFSNSMILAWAPSALRMSRSFRASASTPGLSAEPLSALTRSAHNASMAPRWLSMKSKALRFMPAPSAFRWIRPHGMRIILGFSMAVV
jgi:hypothetical protein